MLASYKPVNQHLLAIWAYRSKSRSTRPTRQYLNVNLLVDIVNLLVDIANQDVDILRPEIGKRQESHIIFILCCLNEFLEDHSDKRKRFESWKIGTISSHAYTVPLSYSCDKSLIDKKMRKN